MTEQVMSPSTPAMPPVQTTRPVPLWLPITGLVLLLIGIFGRTFIVDLFSDEQLAQTALLSGIPFLLVFIAIILFFMSFVWWLAVRFNDRVSARTFRIIEYGFIGGIILGVVMMFQPWVFEFFRYGFYLLLASTLGFIAWSHVSPADPVEVVPAKNVT